MKEFANLIYALGTSTKTNDKLKALVNYFETANDKDKVWAIALFSGRRPKRSVSSAQLRSWTSEYTDLPEWLFNECYHTVGDLSETIALLVGKKNAVSSAAFPLHYYIEKLDTLKSAGDSEKKRFVIESWESLADERSIFVFNKLFSATFRIGVSQQLMMRALARVTNIDTPEIAHLLAGKWDPSTIGYEELLKRDSAAFDISRPYPFFLAYPLENEPGELGDLKDWQCEWKWDGIRGQIVKRSGNLFVWSRGEELMTDRFPEFSVLKNVLPDGAVLDGEILSSINGQPLPFAILQKRIGRLNLSKKILQDAPVAFFAYDLLELHGNDIRNEPLIYRRHHLKNIVDTLSIPVLSLSPELEFTSWDDMSALRKLSRENNAEGFMLKQKNSPYLAGRKRGGWWKWKIDPLTIDAVLVYAQKGSGKRSSLYTDYTFAVRDGDSLVPFAKAYSGLTDKEITRVDNFVKKHAIEKFGPVRTVKPELVFEIAFEGISKSNRHKSGVAIRFPRISRWRTDKPVSEINTLDDLKALLNEFGNDAK